MTNLSFIKLFIKLKPMKSDLFLFHYFTQKRIRQFQLILFFLIPFFLTAQTTWYVNAYIGDDNNTGENWSLAFESFQTAIDVAEAGDQIWLSEGVYIPTLAHGGTTDNHKTFFIQQNIQIYGGFPADGSINEVSGRNPELYKSLLSGDIDGNDINSDGNFIAETADEIVGDNTIHVLWIEPLSEKVEVDGIWINGGLNTSEGAGIYISMNEDSGTSSIILKNCQIIGNKSGRGGGIFQEVTNTSTLNSIISNCNFISNNASEGAGIYSTVDNGICNPTLVNCSFKGNFAFDQGGAIFNQGIQDGTCNPLIVNTVISGNVAFFRGAGIYNSARFGGNCSPTITNCTIVGNAEARVIYGESDEASYNHIIVQNSIIWNNSNSAVVTSFGATQTISYSLVENVQSFVNGNLSGLNANNIPLFELSISPDEAPSIEGNYQLTSCSPLINKGNNTLLPNDIADLNNDMNIDESIPFDLNQNNRISLNNQVDLGAYEFQMITATEPVRLYVNAEAAGNNNGETWENAFVNFQDAIDKACSFGSLVEIWVAEGVYYPTQVYQGTDERNKTFYINKDVKIYGGFSRSNLSTNLEQRNPQIYKTILSGDIDHNDWDFETDENYIAETPSDIFGRNAYHVVWIDRVSEEMILDGFWITAGYASNGANSVGGGIITTCEDRESFTKPNIVNCTVIGNRALNGGGGIYNASINFSLNATNLVNCNILYNEAGSGGGMRNLTGNGADCTISLTNCLFYYNQADFAGAIRSNAGTGSEALINLTNCTITENQATEQIGGIMLTGSRSKVNLKNTVVWNNIDEANAGAEASNLTILNNSRSDFNYSLIQGHVLDGEGNLDGTDINNNPSFINPGLPRNHPILDNNFRLSACSPLINAGNNNLLGNDATDLNNNMDTSEPLPIDLGSETRVFDHQVDIGAYEYQRELLPSNQSIIYVNAEAQGQNNGSSWNDAFVNFQDAIDITKACEEFHEIWVAEGVYKPSKKYGGTSNRRKTFLINKNVEIYGGFPADGSINNKEERNWNIYKAILSGDVDNNDTNEDGDFIAHNINDIQGENAHHVIWTEGQDGLILIDGIFITAGKADEVSNGFTSKGGGLLMLVSKVGSSLQLNNCHFVGNLAIDGGAIYNLNTINNINFHNCYFSKNFAFENGGAISNDGYSRTVLPNYKYCVFEENRTDGCGGAVYNEAFLNGSCYPTFMSCKFRGNYSATNGGAICSAAGSDSDCATRLYNCLFSGNYARNGGGIYSNGSRLSVMSDTLINCTFSGNNAELQGGGMYSKVTWGGDNFPFVRNCVFWNNKSQLGLENINSNLFLGFGVNSNLAYSLIQGRDYPGEHLIPGTNPNNAPSFLQALNPEDAPSIAGDFHVGFCSSLLNQGNNIALPLDSFDLDMDLDTLEKIPFDLDNNIRIYNENIVDIGAYEWQSPAPEPPIVSDCLPNQFIQMNEDCTIILPDFRRFVNVESDCIEMGLTITQTPAPQSLIMDVNKETLQILAQHSNGDSNECTFDISICPPSPVELNSQELEQLSDGDFSSVQQYIMQCTSVPFEVANVNIIGDSGNRNAVIDLQFNLDSGEVLECIVVGNEIENSLAIDELFNFEAKLMANNTVELRWQTETNLSIIHFSVEKSIDGQQFSSIFTINNNSNNKYKVIDSKPNFPQSYYRIVKHFSDGTVKYSSIKLVYFDNEECAIVPNPAHHHATLYFNEIQRKPVQFQIWLPDGRKIHQGKIPPNQKEYPLYFTKWMLLNSSSLVYVELIFENGKRQTLKLFIY